MAAGSQSDWPLAASAFQRFLSWLDQGVDSGGETYLEMRRRLVFYFDRKNCLSPDDLADETLRRVARRLEEEGEITGKSPAHYCYIVASFLFLEYQRWPARQSRQPVRVRRRGLTFSSPIPAGFLGRGSNPAPALPGRLPAGPRPGRPGPDCGVLSRRAARQNPASPHSRCATRPHAQCPQHSRLPDSGRTRSLRQNLLCPS